MVILCPMAGFQIKSIINQQSISNKINNVIMVIITAGIIICQADYLSGTVMGTFTYFTSLNPYNNL